MHAASAVAVGAANSRGGSGITSPPTVVPFPPLFGLTPRAAALAPVPSAATTPPHAGGWPTDGHIDDTSRSCSQAPAWTVTATDETPVDWGFTAAAGAGGATSTKTTAYGTADGSPLMTGPPPTSAAATRPQSRILAGTPGSVSAAVATDLNANAAPWTGPVVSRTPPSKHQPSSHYGGPASTSAATTPYYHHFPTSPDSRGVAPPIVTPAHVTTLGASTSSYAAANGFHPTYHHHHHSQMHVAASPPAMVSHHLVASHTATVPAHLQLAPSPSTTGAHVMPLAPHFGATTSGGAPYAYDLRQTPPRNAGGQTPPTAGGFHYLGGGGAPHHNLGMPDGLSGAPPPFVTAHTEQEAAVQAFVQEYDAEVRQFLTTIHQHAEAALPYVTGGPKLAVDEGGRHSMCDDATSTAVAEIAKQMCETNRRKYLPLAQDHRGGGILLRLAGALRPHFDDATLIDDQEHATMTTAMPTTPSSAIPTPSGAAMNIASHMVLQSMAVDTAKAMPQIMLDHHGAGYLQRLLGPHNGLPDSLIVDPVLRYGLHPIFVNLCLSQPGSFAVQKLYDMLAQRALCPPTVVATRPSLGGAIPARPRHNPRSRGDTTTTSGPSASTEWTVVNEPAIVSLVDDDDDDDDTASQRNSLIQQRPATSLAEALTEPIVANIVVLATDHHAMHVVQKAMSVLDDASRSVLIDAMLKHFVAIAADKHGCCCVQRCLERAALAAEQCILAEGIASGTGNDPTAAALKHQRTMAPNDLSQILRFVPARDFLRLASAVADHAVTLALSPFGNYVVQNLLDKTPQVVLAHPLLHDTCDRIVLAFTHPSKAIVPDGFLQLSCCQTSSKCVEKVLKVASADVLTREVFPQVTHQTHWLAAMMADGFGNYVAQSLTEVASTVLWKLQAEAIAAAASGTPKDPIPLIAKFQAVEKFLHHCADVLPALLASPTASGKHAKKIEQRLNTGLSTFHAVKATLSQMASAAARNHTTAPHPQPGGTTPSRTPASQAAVPSPHASHGAPQPLRESPSTGGSVLRRDGTTPQLAATFSVRPTGGPSTACLTGAGATTVQEGFGDWGSAWSPAAVAALLRDDSSLGPDRSVHGVQDVQQPGLSRPSSVPAVCATPPHAGGGGGGASHVVLEQWAVTSGNGTPFDAAASGAHRSLSSTSTPVATVLPPLASSASACSAAAHAMPPSAFVPPHQRPPLASTVGTGGGPVNHSPSQPLHPSRHRRGGGGGAGGSFDEGTTAGLPHGAGRGSWAPRPSHPAVGFTTPPPATGRHTGHSDDEAAAAADDSTSVYVLQTSHRSTPVRGLHSAVVPTAQTPPSNRHRGGPLAAGGGQMPSPVGVPAGGGGLAQSPGAVAAAGNQGGSHGGRHFAAGRPTGGTRR